MQFEYKCPLCKSAIRFDDINEETDIALCRSCGRTFPVSVTNCSAELSQDSLNKTPRWIRIEDDIMGRKTIVYRRTSPFLLFFLPFTAIWSGISLWSCYDILIRQGKLDQFPQMLPFILGSMLLLSVVAFLFFGKWVITLQSGTGKVFVGLGSLGWTRHFTYNRNSLAGLNLSKICIKHHVKPENGVWIKTGQKEIVFGALLKEEVKQFIAATIMKEIQKV